VLQQKANSGRMKLGGGMQRFQLPELVKNNRRLFKIYDKSKRGTDRRRIR